MKELYRFRQFLAEGKLLKEDQKYYSLLNDLRDEGLLNKSGISGLQSKFNLSKEKAKEIFDEYLEDLKAEQPDAFDFFMKDLAEGKLFEQEMSFDNDIENNTNKNDFFFWYRGGKRGEKQALQAKELLQKNGIDADYSLGPYYINFSKAGVEQRVAHQILRDAGLTNFIIGNTNDMTIN